MTVVGRCHHLHAHGAGKTQLSLYIRNIQAGVGLPGDGEHPTPRTGRGLQSQTEKAGAHLHGMIAGGLDGVDRRQEEKAPADGGPRMAKEKMEANKTEMYKDDPLVFYPLAPQVRLATALARREEQATRIHPSSRLSQERAMKTGNEEWSFGSRVKALASRMR